MKRILIVNFLIFINLIYLLLQTSCAVKQEPESFKRSEYALGTIINVTLFKETDESVDLEQAMSEAFGKLSEIEKITSAKLSDSELSFVNENAFLKEVVVSDELFGILEISLEFSELTDGAFDITLGRLIELWGIGTKNERLPAAEEIEKAKSLCGYENLVLDSESNSVRFLKDLRLDLGAIAKGYAADEMKRVLKENNVTEAILDLGGNIVLIGDNYGKGYRVGIINPRDAGRLSGVLCLKDKTAVTSGDYERYFTNKDTGERYHHIFDRSTGYPAKSGVMSVTVVSDSGVVADALSTACFVMGGLGDIEGEAVFITDGGEKIITKGLTDYFEE